MNDTQIARLIAKEEARQREVINLIASENYVSSDELCATFATVAQDGERFGGRWSDHKEGEQCETIVYDIRDTSGEFNPRMSVAN
ncbi:MAG: hypothetical protein Q8P93_02930 [bacterium]|nr:hypothetical protein [bacterium]